MNRLSFSPSLMIACLMYSASTSSAEFVALAARVPKEEACRRELAELVPHHVLGHVDRDELVAVVHGEGVADEVGEHRARARPRLDHLLRARRVLRLDLLHEGQLDERALLYASRHCRLSRITAWPYRASARGRSSAATASSCCASSRLPSCPTG